MHIEPGHSATKIEASAWLVRWKHLVRPGGTVLDVACGSGRHMHYMAQFGHAVTGIDRSQVALAAASLWGRVVLSDIETEPWPLQDTALNEQPQVFDALVVTNYLWRPLFSTWVNSLAAGGVLIYETFATGQETVGKPSNPDFLLLPGELLRLCAGLKVVAFEDGFEDRFEDGSNRDIGSSAPRFVQRIVAVRDAPKGQPRARHALDRHGKSN